MGNLSKLTHSLTAIFLIIIAIFISCSTNKKDIHFKLQAKEQPLANNAIEQRVNALYEKMSINERLAQLHGMYVTNLLGKDGHIDTIKCKELISNGIGHFSQYAGTTELDPNQLRDIVAEIQNWILANTPNAIPALFHEEVLSGIATKGATTYPQQIGVACSFNPILATQKTKETAADFRKIGGMLSLSPMVDVCRTPSFNRLEESYGEDGYLSAAMGVAFVQGLQDGGLKKGVAACSKHFLGYGGGGNAQTKELMEDILLPHEAMIRVAGSKVVMTGYHSVNDTNCVANNYLQQDILRNYLQFDGVMVSDYSSIGQISTEPDALHQAVTAINAGNDVEFPELTNYAFLPEAIEKDLVSQKVFERAVKRVLTLKCALGLLDENPILYEKDNIVYDTPEERATAYELATQSVVLLKNNGILPLKDSQNIALTGPNANSMWAMLGDYTYQGMGLFWRFFNPSDKTPLIVNLRQGLDNKKPEGITINYSRGCDWTDVVETKIERGGDPRTAWLIPLLDRRIDAGEPIDRKATIEMASQSDVIIAAMGENDLLCGENRDRNGLRLPGSQEAFVEELVATNKPVVLIVFGGRAQVLGSLVDKCAAVIQAWYPGEEGGNALADIIYGNISPSGKLSVSYPAVEIYEPICYNYSATPDPRVQFPFGYGLSYTDFTYSNLNVKNEVDINCQAIKLSFDLTNSGNMKADEIVQIYLSPADGQPIHPIQLQGFGRVTLCPGESREVTFIISPEQFGYFCSGRWNIDKGKYLIQVGASSTDIRLKQEITLTGKNISMPLRSIYFAEMQ